MNKRIFFFSLLLLPCFVSPAAGQLPKVEPTAVESAFRSVKFNISSKSTRILGELKRIPFWKKPTQTNFNASAVQARVEASKILSSASLEPAFLKGPQIKPLEENIHRFIFTISPRNNPKLHLGTGFIFAQTTPGRSTRLWGATSAGIAQQAGTDIIITFHSRKPVSFPAKIVLSGNPQGANAALIEIPEAVYSVALPVELATEDNPLIKQRLMAYGFDKKGRLQKKGAFSFFNGTERSLAQTTAPYNTACLKGGLVVDPEGWAHGIFTKTYVLPENTSLPKGYKQQVSLLGTDPVIEFTPIQRVVSLLREYEQAHNGARIILFDGKKIGKVEVDETIENVFVLYKGKPMVTLDPNPLWTLYNLEEFIPDLDQATLVYMYISGGERGRFCYEIDLKGNRITETPLPE